MTAKFQNGLFLALGIALFVALVAGSVLALFALPVLLAEKHTYAVYWLLLLIGIMAIYINTWLFFSRLRRIDPETHGTAMRHLPYVSYVVSTRTGPLALTGWLIKISTDETGRYARSLRIHAAVARWLNIVWLIAGIVAAVWGALLIKAA